MNPLKQIHEFPTANRLLTKSRTAAKIRPVKKQNAVQIC
jgi:hypothetical protein